MNRVNDIESDDRRTSRLISLLERRDPEGVRQLKGLYDRCGKAHVIGVTGPPGAGKSCLVSALIGRFRQLGRSVGILAVDPSSPFTGGAILGDRARMTDCSGDRGVFIRSFSARGASGGLAPVINDAVDVLDAFGKEIIIVETVGVGQVEVDIARIAHTVILTLVPGYGDTLQAMKAGIMEIGDILVMNKADEPGCDKAVNDLANEMPFSFNGAEYQCANLKGGTWPVPVVKTSALFGQGLDELVAFIDHHREHLKEDERLEQLTRARRNRQFLDILTEQVREAFLDRLETDGDLRRWVTKIEALEVDPYSASEQVIDLIGRARNMALHERGSARMGHQFQQA